MPCIKRSAWFLAVLFILGAVSLYFSAFLVRAQEEIDQEKLDRGARLYQENCAVCHGPDGEGRVGATLARNWPSIRPDLTVQNTIENGIPGTAMPPWSQANGGPLSEDQIDDLVYFILSWQTGGAPAVEAGPSPTRRPTLEPIPEVSGDPNNGAVLYDANCVVCHGVNGEGRIGATLERNWPSIRPDLSVRNVIMNGVAGSPMPAWSQANGGPLTDQEIDDLTAFILTLEAANGAPQSGEQQTALPVQPGVSWAIWVGALILVILVGVLFSSRNR
jgi:mono/diheme cytochrome c family protein